MFTHGTAGAVFSTSAPLFSFCLKWNRHQTDLKEQSHLHPYRSNLVLYLSIGRHEKATFTVGTDLSVSFNGNK